MNDINGATRAIDICDLVCVGSGLSCLVIGCMADGAFPVADALAGKLSSAAGSVAWVAGSEMFM